jgi:hypothetical protein
MTPRALTVLVPLLMLLASCDMLGIESPEKVAARKEAEGRAIGAACREAGRAIEDCYTLNPKADKAAMFSGWRDMADYMRENKIEETKPSLPHPTLVKQAKAASAAEAKAKADAEAAKEAAKEGGEEPATKPSGH